MPPGSEGERLAGSGGKVLKVEQGRVEVV
jgi:hypothetical protein